MVVRSSRSESNRIASIRPSRELGAAVAETRKESMLPPKPMRLR